MNQNINLTIMTIMNTVAVLQFKNYDVAKFDTHRITDTIEKIMMSNIYQSYLLKKSYLISKALQEFETLNKKIVIQN